MLKTREKERPGPATFAGQAEDHEEMISDGTVKILRCFVSVGAFRNAGLSGCDNCVSFIDARIDLSPLVAAMKRRLVEMGFKAKGK